MTTEKLKELHTRVLQIAREIQNLKYSQKVESRTEELRSQRDTIKEISASLHSIQSDLTCLITGIEVSLLESWMMKPKIYIIRRLSDNADQPLKWHELKDSDTWASGSYSILDVALREAARRNQKENSPSHHRAGFQPGLYVHQVWHYDPNLFEEEQWQRIEHEHKEKYRVDSL